MVADRLRGARAALDVQAGGGELLSRIDQWPPRLVAAEGWLPNVAVAGRNLHGRGGHVVAANDDRPALPFRGGAFDLVVSRHPVTAWWEEIARVVAPGGSYLSQQVGPRSMFEVAEWFLGPQPTTSHRSPALAVAGAEAAGLDVVDLRDARLRAEFHDIGAVIYFLRLVIWIVPGFDVTEHRGRLRVLHEEIEARGPFVAHATRFLIEARKP